MITTLTKATSRGQITLPKAWRDKFKTNQYIMKSIGNKLYIIPMDKKAIDHFIKKHGKII